MSQMSLFNVSNLTPRCKRWCGWGRRWVWWDVGVALWPRGTCSPLCAGWRCLCGGSIVPSYLSGHTAAAWRWQSPKWCEGSFCWRNGASWRNWAKPWRAGPTSSRTTNVDLMRCAAKTKTRGILISDCALFVDCTLFSFVACMQCHYNLNTEPKHH